jgi:hypothetical protein
MSKTILRALLKLKASEAVNVTLDQLVCSAGNFLTTFILVRTISSPEFGVFALLYGIAILGLNVNNWLIRSFLAKNSNYGKVAIQARRDRCALVFTSLLLGTAISVVLIGGAVFLRQPSLWPPLVLIALSTQVQETLRRAAMAQQQAMFALVPDAVSYLGQATLVSVLSLTSTLSLRSALWAVGLTSSLAILIQMRLLGTFFALNAECLVVVRQCWSQGAYVLTAGLLSSVPLYAMPWGIASARGAAEAGRFAAIIAILGVGHPLMISTAWLILLSIGRAAASGKHLDLRRLMQHVAPQLGLLTGYWILIVIFPATLLRTALGGRFATSDTIVDLRFAVVYYCCFFAALCLELSVDAVQLGRPRIIVEGVTATMMIIVGIPLIMLIGVRGAIVAGIAVHCMRMVGFVLLLMNRQRGRVFCIQSLSALNRG